MIAAWFSLAVIATLALTLWAAKLNCQALELAVGAGVIATFFAAKRVIDWHFGESIPPWTMAHYPLQDVVLLSACWMSWRHHPMKSEVWKVVLAGLFLAQLGAHATYWLNQDRSPLALYLYILTNNVLFACELGVLFITGGGYVARGLTARLRRPRLGGGPDPVGSR